MCHTHIFPLTSHHENKLPTPAPKKKGHEKKMFTFLELFWYTLRVVWLVNYQLLINFFERRRWPLVTNPVLFRIKTKAALRRYVPQSKSYENLRFDGFEGTTEIEKKWPKIEKKKMEKSDMIWFLRNMIFMKPCFQPALLPLCDNDAANSALVGSSSVWHIRSWIQSLTCLVKLFYSTFNKKTNFLI